MSAQKLPMADVGDIFQSYAITGLYCRAVLVSIQIDERGENIWSGVLMTKNGVEFVSSSVEIRGKYDWVPATWEWDGGNWVETKEEPAEEVEAAPAPKVSTRTKKAKRVSVPAL
jgi:hypothetical protein